VAPTLGKAQAATNPTDVDVEQQLLSKSAGGDSLTNFPLTEAHLDGSVGKE